MRKERHTRKFTQTFRSSKAMISEVDIRDVARDIFPNGCQHIFGKSAKVDHND